MKYRESEKRIFPRIDAELPIQISPEFIGTTVDLSEVGFKFILQKPLLLTRAKAKIKLSAEEYIDTEFKVIWNKHLLSDGKFTYGACFIRLKEKDLENLRTILIKNSLKSLLNKVGDKKTQDLISNFWNVDFKDYMNKLVKMAQSLEQGEDKEKIYKEIVTINDNIVQKGDELENQLNNKILIKKVKKAFREICGPWVYKAEIVKHAFEKPRGYPGDYKLIEIIYDNKPLSSALGYCYDKYLLSNAYAVAVRNRENEMGKILRDFIIKEVHLPKIRILNIACGSCREIKEVLSDSKLLLKNNVSFSLVDQDEEALKFSEESLNEVVNKVPLHFFQHNVLDYINQNSKYSEILGKYDLIYSIGLADYLPDRVLKNLISFCFNLLNSKGRLIIAHKDVSKYKPLPPDWWCDWSFYPREENHLLNLIVKSEIDGFDIKISREPSNIILFITIQKV
ncbi:MAG: hypothetical protein C4533_05215 [Candidatus Omnitrophota bacterium]|jgi:hypothetical protein|nr:MAG: hypothetical protein C4533_05215 [Candidatus Omnitrophota bacterium]